jgi:hypothetical protein
MKTIFAAALLCLPIAACTFALGRRAATAPVSTAAATAAPASHDQLCSQLRADIGSSQHNQRTAPPGSNAPIIAAASEGKEDQKIEALQRRYSEMGCVGNPSTSGSPTP